MTRKETDISKQFCSRDSLILKNNSKKTSKDLQIKTISNYTFWDKMYIKKL